MEDLQQLKYLEGYEITDLKQIKSTKKDRPDWNNKYYKLFYFILREGLVSTIRKTLAHSKPQFRYLTILYIKTDNKKYVNISTQWQTNAEDFVVENKFHPCEKEINVDAIKNNLEFYFNNYNQFSGVVNYETLNIDNSEFIELTKHQPENKDTFEKGLFVYGLGGYVNMFIMHHFKDTPKICCVDYKADIGKTFKEKYKFNKNYLIPHQTYGDLKNTKKPIAIIASFHSDHAKIAYNIFKTNPNSKIFVEKPPTVTLDDIEKLISLYNNGADLEMGFNRRHIKFNRYIKKIVQNKKIIISCSIKEVLISDNHWYFWPNQGTRVTGNIVHWFDLATFWTNSKPVEINVMAHNDDPESPSITVMYENGSILNITASDKGNSLRGVQEKIEVRFDNETIFIDDYLKLVHFKNNGLKKTKRNLIRKKGHENMYKYFKQSIAKNRKSDYTPKDMIYTSVVTYHASQMLKNGIKNLNIEKTINNYLDKIIM